MNFQEAFFDELEKIAERRSLNKEAGAPKPFKKLGVDVGSFARNVVDFIPENPGEAFQYANFYANAARHKVGSAWDNFWIKPGSYKRLPRNNFERVTGKLGNKLGNIKLATEKLGEFDPNALSNVLNAMDSAMPGHGPTNTLMAVTKYYGPRLKGAGSKISDLIKKLVENKKIKI